MTPQAHASPASYAAARAHGAPPHLPEPLVLVRRSRGRTEWAAQALTRAGRPLTARGVS
ncbi:hypothetical protein [Streptomyces sp. NPDC007264]|uniref:hypothetical protein n=1 Tax=Streptomyces sp. NPDC007264 TaxID=3364777 RepID=UPI0036DB4D40